MAKKKETKPRADKYEQKVSVNGTFEDLLRVAVSPAPKKEDEAAGKEEDKEGNANS